MVYFYTLWGKNHWVALNHEDEFYWDVQYVYVYLTNTFQKFHVTINHKVLCEPDI